MKRKLTVIIALVLSALILSSCGNMRYLAHVYEVDDGTYDFSQYKYLNHKNIVSAKPKSSVDSKKPTSKTLSLSDTELKLQYSESLYYPIGDMTLDVYLADGSEDKKVSFEQDGSINSIMYEFDSFKLQSADRVFDKDLCPFLEERLKTIVDLTSFKHQRSSQSANDSAENGYEYHHIYYNEVGGCTTDYVEMYTIQRGDVVSILNLKIYRSNTDMNDYSISRGKFEKLLHAKMKDIYSTDGVDLLLNYEIISLENSNDLPLVITYKGDKYIRISLYAMFMEYERYKEHERYKALGSLIPSLRLISDEELELRCDDDILQILLPIDEMLDEKNQK